MKHYRLLLPLLILLLGGLFHGCIADRCNPREMDENGEITLLLRAPAMDVDQSLRQMSIAQESAISDLNIFVFKTKDDEGNPLDEEKETYAYQAPISMIKKQKGNDNYYEVKARLRVDDTTNPYRLVLIANKDFSTYNSPEYKGKTKEAFLAEMVREWTSSTKVKENIPMWGESDAKVITKGVTFGDCRDTQSSNRIHLIRSLARVDVGLNFADDVTSEEATPTTETPFKITSVRVYRYATQYSIPGSQKKTFHMEGTMRKPQPLIPEGTTLATDTQPILYETISSDKCSVRDIYIPEREKSTELAKRACIVVGGKYSTDYKETFYRLDFIKTPTVASPRDTAEPLDILRNHRYRFNIKKVMGPGNETPEEALISEPINIAFDVVVWNDGEVGTIAYDGQYYLSVSQSEFEFGKNPSEENFTVRTNWPQGFKIVDAQGNEYPSSKEAATAAGKWTYFTKQGTFKVDKDQKVTLGVLENTTNKVRTLTRDQLFVQAGRIKWPLEVKQSDKIQLDIEVFLKETSDWHTDCAEDPIEEYTCYPDKEYSFWVRYTPNAKVGRVPLVSDEFFEWTLESDDSSSGIALFKVIGKSDKCKEDLFRTESTEFRVDLQDIATKSVNFTLYLKKWDALPYSDAKFEHNLLYEQQMYLLGNFNQHFFIRANTPYRLKIKTIEMQKISGNPTEDKVVKEWTVNKELLAPQLPSYVQGEMVNFLTYDHIGTSDDNVLGSDKIITSTVTFLLSPQAEEGQEGYFKEHEFKIYFLAGILQPEANTYVIEEGQVPIFIPLSQINKAADWWNAHVSIDLTMQRRVKEGNLKEQGISYNAYCNYMSKHAQCTTPKQGEEIGAPLWRIEDDDTEWTVEPVWSTLSPIGAEHGLEKVSNVHIDLGCKNYIVIRPKPQYEGVALVSAVKQHNSNPRIIWNWTIWVVKKKSKQGNGYPWDDAENQAYGVPTAAPYMNRNLGAYRVSCDPTKTVFTQFNSDMAGLYYRHGTQVPHHAYEVDLKTSSVGAVHCSKVWYNTQLVPEQKQTQMKKKMYDGLFEDALMYSMHDIITLPCKVPIRARIVSDCILEMSTNEWGGFLAKEMWQGGSGKACLPNYKSFKEFAYKTEKTPFDPSPYGWKVPAAGAESDNMTKKSQQLFSPTGFIHKGELHNFKNFNHVVLHMATRRVNSDYIIVSYRSPLESEWIHFGTRVTEESFPFSQCPIRCIENEAESDYRDYTQDGVMKRQTNAIKAVRHYHY